MDTRKKNRLEQQAAINLDKIIRHEEANSLVYAHQNSGSDRIRALPNPQEREKLLSSFWRILNQIYFAKINESDLEILDFIRDTFMSSEINQVDSQYANRISKEVVQSLLSENYQNMFSEQKNEMNKLNFSNLLKHYFISIRMYLPLLTRPYTLDDIYIKQFTEIHKTKNSYKVPKDNTDYEMNTYLKDENQALDKALKCQDSVSIEEDAKINSEIDLLKTQQGAINKINVDQVEKVLERITENTEELSTDLLMDTSHISRKIRGEYNQAADRISTEKEFLKSIIYQLEERQIVDSIRYISEVTPNSYYDDRMYEVWFDDSVTKLTMYLEENYVKRINKHRDSSQFGIHNIGYKCKKPFYSHNFVGNEILNKANFEYQFNMKNNDYLIENETQIGHEQNTFSNRKKSSSRKIKDF